MYNIDKEVNVLGKSCPIPIILLSKAVVNSEVDQIIKISGDDPIFEDSIIDFCKDNHCEILERNIDGDAITIILKKLN